jgi:hypothetical protein
MRSLKMTALSALIITLVPATAKASEATLTAIGDLDRLSLGQAGFCGARVEVGQSEWQKVSLKGDEQLWFFAKSRYRTPKATYNCDIERTFLPVSGKAYLLRISHEPNNCKVELFRVVPGADPVREPLLKPEPKSCALQ